MSDIAEPRKKTSLTSAGIKLSILILLSRLLGLIREMTKASFLGTGHLADAFSIAFLIPNLFRRLFAENSISVAFIPTFRGYVEENDPAKTKEFIASTFTVASFITAIFVTLGMIFTPFIVKLFFNKTDTQTLQETIILTRIMFPYLFVISTAAFFQGILNGVNIFSPSGATPILFNIVVISSTYILSPHTANPARAMATGVVTGGIIQALFQLPFVLKTNWKIKLAPLKKSFSNPGTKKVITLIGPTIVGMAAYQLNDIVSTALAGKAGTGIVSSLQYSLRLQELILGIFAVSIGTVILPDLSGLAKKEDWENFNNMLLNAVKIIMLITIPVTFYSLVSGREIISLIYKNNRFNQMSVMLTLRAFNFHILGLCFIALNRVIAPAFYAQGCTKKPTMAGILGFAVNIFLAFLLVGKMKGGGIALSLTIASFANTVFLFVFLNGIKTICVAKIVKSSLLYLAKLTFFSATAAIPAFFTLEFLRVHFSGRAKLIAYGLPLAITAAVFSTTGIILLVISKDNIARIIIHKIGRKK
ncbi:murein biosynthesis integral membrane protein MurJ [Treponema parvum]|uniref:Probable lipid II flippase MurJ n=1 Tax=Treponema parvum TaxID=138851 RepID=A0A975F2Z8_9SPIR|nr:murein biosynthesis integral membrane protein MurJ [Treponema parvum]QTQ13418.1 murein biosynthesis integral membrane protein MurJ [Treponema parvum]